MGDDDHRDAQLLVDLADQFQNRVGGVGVQGAGGFVAQQHLGVGSQRTGNGDALLLAAGKLGRVSFGLIRQADQLQQLAGAGLGLFLGHFGQLHREHDVAQAGALHQQVELLEDHGDPAAGGTQLGCRQLLHLAAVDNDLALVRALQHIDAPYQRGLAGAGHADDAVDVAILNGQVNIIQRDDRTALRGKAFGQVLQFDHGSLPLFFTKIANGRQNPFAINFTLKLIALQ